MPTWVQDHLDELIARFAAEDEKTPEEWKQGAVYYVVRRRYEGEKAMEEAHARMQQ